MRAKLLPFCRALISEEEIAEVVDALRSGWITTGPKTKRFEREFAAYLGAPTALALSSCTAAMHVALTTLGIGPGDAVITTSMTFCSGIHVIEQLGARPILVDVEPDTLNLDPVKVRETLEKLSKRPNGTGRVKAIVPVHLYGHPCDMDALLEIAEEYKVAVIEDAAHALPAKYNGRMIGSLAASPSVPALTCFSFYATKNLTTTEGGMLTGTSDLVDEARIWSLHGMSHNAWKRYDAEGSWHYEVTRPGFKYNMTDIEAALGLHQLRRLPSFHARRLEIVRRYDAAFAGCDELQTPAVRPEVEHAWHLYVLRLNANRFEVPRNQFIEELRARNIATSVHFIPVHLHQYYRTKYGYQPDDFPVAYREFQRMISLPLYPAMDNRDVDDVVEAVYEVVEKSRRKSRAYVPSSIASLSAPTSLSP